MKKKILIISITTSLIFVTGCKKDFLEEKRDLTGVNEEVFKDPLLANAYVDFVYGLFLAPNNAQTLSWTLATNNIQFAQTTEEFPGETNWNKPGWSTVSYLNGHALGYFGSPLTGSIANNTWTRMKQINTFLSNIDKHGLSSDITNPLKGQLYFWRAWQYFDLVRLYGGVPLVLEPQDPISTGEISSLQIPRSKTSDCIAQIVSDLDMAASLLPGKWDGSDWGRITSGAAAAFKGRVLLTWASPLFNRTDDVSRWQAAYDANLAAKTLLEANGFGLFTDGGFTDGKAWGNMWFKEVDNPEAVIVYGYNNSNSSGQLKNNGWEQACRPKAINGGSSLSPTKQMVDAFPMKDGKMPGASTYTYDANKFYKDRDPRFYKTFAYNGAIWPYQANSNYKLWTYYWWKNASEATPSNKTETLGANNSGIYLAKATAPNANNSGGNFQYSGTDYMQMRFAEVVLNLAESAIGINKLSEGLELIKSIRERAGVENLDGAYGLATAISRDELFAAVLNERKIEFAYEGKRFYDLRRWMLFNNDYGTCARLGVTPLNDTRRTGYYITVKKPDGTPYVAAQSVDPLIKPATGNAPVINRDSAFANTSAYNAYVDYLYDNYFVVNERDNIDPTTNDWKFKWFNQYYFFGFNSSILNSSSYLEQTKDWDGLTGQGTFDPLQ